jgi:tripartite-type tricarboxylate transporter receptor subunit TctC
MNKTRKDFGGTVASLAAAIAAAAGLSVNTAALAAYPEKPVTIVVPTAPGGGNDAMARIISQKFSQALGQPVIIDNKAGGNGAIASEYVARASPDGYTIMFGYIATHAMNPALQKLRYDPVADFEPIGLVATSPVLMVVNPDAGVKDVADFLKQARADPAKFSYASAGNGTAPHFAAELFKLVTGVSILHVPYKGSGPAMTDTLGGQTQLMFPSLIGASPHIKAGKLKALAVAGNKRTSTFPSVPTLKEAGVEGVDVTQWYGMFAPAHTPKAVIVKLNAALNSVLKDKDIVARFAAQGGDVETDTPEQFGALVKSELVKWRQVVQKAKLVAD